MQHQDHFGGESVAAGPYKLWPGGALYFMSGDFDVAGAKVVLIPLADEEGVPRRIMRVGEYSVLSCPLKDYGGVPEFWEDFLKSSVIPKLAEGKHLIPFCKGGHGRTGTFLASLIALLEPDVTDPIAAVRDRYCEHAVETIEQGKAIFALVGRPLPLKYLSGPDVLDPLTKLSTTRTVPTYSSKKKKNKTKT